MSSEKAKVEINTAPPQPLSDSEIIAKAKKLVEAEKAERANECLEELNDVLKKHDCYWDVMSKLDKNTLSSVIVIVPKDR